MNIFSLSQRPWDVYLSKPAPSLSKRVLTPSVILFTSNRISVAGEFCVLVASSVCPPVSENLNLVTFLKIVEVASQKYI